MIVQEQEDDDDDEVEVEEKVVEEKNETMEYLLSTIEYEIEC